MPGSQSAIIHVQMFPTTFITTSGKGSTHPGKIAWFHFGVHASVMILCPRLDIICEISRRRPFADC